MIEQPDNEKPRDEWSDWRLGPSGPIGPLDTDMWDNKVEFSTLIGKTLKSVEVNEHRDEILFETVDGEKFKMWHYQDCCESVTIEDIDGDLDKLVGSRIAIADESSSGEIWNDDHESSTWTFYKLATNEQFVTIRWLGSSNGYYSERVDFERVD